tara:strand:+ start:190 stop:381 length:192 start_codon:yes stop_codon:yes gene_type:complete
MIGMNRNVEYWKKEIATQIVYSDLLGFIENTEDISDLTIKESKALEKAAYYVGELLIRTYLRK